MDPATALILAAIIGGVFSVIVEFIKKWPIKTEKIDKSATSVDEAENKKIGIRGKKKTNNKPKPRKKVFDLPFLPRMGIIFFLAVIFLYHTGIIFFPPTLTSNDSCPNRQNIQTTKDIEIKVKNGYVAYFMGWEFDKENGGFFVTFRGPYKGMHSFNNGIYCPPIPEETELSQKTVDMLMENCEQSSGGCSKSKTCTQNIFAYHLLGGECHE
jgi:hypothetical protein